MSVANFGDQYFLFAGDQEKLRWYVISWDLEDKKLGKDEVSKRSKLQMSFWWLYVIIKDC